MSETIDINEYKLGSYNDYLESNGVNHSQESLAQYTRELQAQALAEAAIRGVDVIDLHYSTPV